MLKQHLDKLEFRGNQFEKQLNEEIQYRDVARNMIDVIYEIGAEDAAKNYIKTVFSKSYSRKDNK